MPRKRLSDNLVPFLPNTMYLKSKTESQVLAKAHLGIAKLFWWRLIVVFSKKKRFTEKKTIHDHCIKSMLLTFT